MHRLYIIFSDGAQDVLSRESPEKTVTVNMKSTPNTVFWLRWVISSALGVAVGFVAAGALLDSVGGAPFDRLNDVVSFGLVAGGLGLGQWRSLSRIVAGAGAWPLATLVGGVAAGALADVLAGGINAIAVFAGFGLLIGVAQWLVLSRWVGQAWWWVIASTLGWTLGIRALSVVNASGLAESLAVSDRLGPALDYALMGALAGVVTGATLVWLARQRTATGQR